MNIAESEIINLELARINRKHINFDLAPMSQCFIDIMTSENIRIRQNILNLFSINVEGDLIRYWIESKGTSQLMSFYIIYRTIFLDKTKGRFRNYKVKGLIQLCKMNNCYVRVWKVGDITYDFCEFHQNDYWEYKASEAGY